jgi:hypothetical protein
VDMGVRWSAALSWKFCAMESGGLNGQKWVDLCWRSLSFSIARKENNMLPDELGFDVH